MTSTSRANSGEADDAIVSPKASVIYTVGTQTEVYASAGKAFHSNDARGTTITIDPVSGDPAERVDPLVASRSVELGFKSFVERKLNFSAALWLLELDSELLFVGDAGNTEASRPSRRYGIEVPVYYRLNDALTFDVELALARSRFTEDDPAGERIPGSIDRVVAAGITVQRPTGFYGNARIRYFGARPLIEDGSVASDPSTVVNAGFGYKRGPFDWRIDVLNLLDSTDDDITYWYASRLAGEPDEGVEDYHFHPIEPRNVRLYMTWKF
jgi:outer membrane receptor protein involved in Fe transport